MTDIEENLEKTYLEVIEVKLDPNNGNRITGYLKSSIYKNKPKVTIVELTSNAIDATRRASEFRKVPKPIVTIENSLIVRDFADGMSPEVVRDVYANMANSISRDDKSAIGALGIGSKSPLSYSNHFFLDTIYDKIKYYYKVFSREDNSIGIALINKESTNEIGTTVTVPIQPNDVKEFKDIAAVNLRFFDIETIGFTKDKFYGANVFENENGIMRADKGIDYVKDPGVVILLGPVMYSYTFSKAAPKYIVEMFKYSHTIIKFKTHELKFILSREELEICKENDIAIENRLKLFLSNFWENALKEIPVNNVLELVKSYYDNNNNNLLSYYDYFLKGFSLSQILDSLGYYRYYTGNTYTTTIDIFDLIKCKKVYWTNKINKELEENLVKELETNFLIIRLSKNDDPNIVKYVKENVDSCDNLFAIAKKEYQVKKNRLQDFNCKISDFLKFGDFQQKRMAIDYNNEDDVFYIIHKYNGSLSNKLLSITEVCKLFNYLPLTNKVKHIQVAEDVSKQLLENTKNYILEEDFYVAFQKQLVPILEVYACMKAMHSLNITHIINLEIVWTELYPQSAIYDFKEKYYNSLKIDMLNTTEGVVNDFNFETPLSKEIKTFVDSRPYLKLIGNVIRTQTLKECESLLKNC